MTERATRRVTQGRVIAAVALCALASCSLLTGLALAATTAATRGSMLTLTGAGDENRPEVTLEGDVYVIRDSASGTLVAGHGCTAEGDPSVFVTAVRCPSASVALLSVNLSAGEDELRLAVPAITAVRAGSGEDSVNGGPGKDTVDGEADADEIDGGSGSDKIVGGGGDDDLKGGSGADAVSGSGGDDDIRGGTGANTLNGDAGDDSIMGSSGKDTILGGNGADELTGGPGGDTLNGGKGSDEVKGNGGKDSVDVRDGRRDTVNCGAGRDTVRADRKDILKGCERKRVR